MNPKIPKKDRFIVMALWIGLTLAIRQVLFIVEPVRWVGTLGALFASVAIVMLLFYYYKPLQKYQTRFTAVIRSWYNRAFYYAGVGLLTVFVIGLAALEYGHANYQDIADHFVESVNVGDPEYDEKLLQEASVVFNDQVQWMILMMTIMDTASEGQVHWLMWIMVSEQSEFILLVMLVRRGIIFKDVKLTV